MNPVIIIVKMKSICFGINMEIGVMYTTNMKSREMLVKRYENVSITLLDRHSQTIILLLLCVLQFDQSTFRRNI
jgi:hypothetical protein